jgi:hypothetical protein
MSAAPWAAHFGLARTPFGKSIPARDLFPRPAHAEAIARISFCVVDTGGVRYWNCLNASVDHRRPAGDCPRC